MRDFIDWSIENMPRLTNWAAGTIVSIIAMVAYAAASHNEFAIELLKRVAVYVGIYIIGWIVMSIYKMWRGIS